jgi:hypothetical protein
MHAVADIVSTLGTGFIGAAIVGNIHPSLENDTYHAVHDIGLQRIIMERFYVAELELSLCKADECPTCMPG